MAHNAIGLDLGSSEVRAVVVRVSLRQREIVQLDREKVVLDETGGSDPAEVLAAAGRLIKRINTEGASIHCAITGELASIRKIIMPASAARRLDQVLKFELDEVLPFDIEDAIFDYIETDRNAKEMVLQTATVLHEQVEQMVSGLESQDISPREIGVDTFAYLNRISSGDQGDEVIAFVDIGHSRTNIAILDQSEPTIRTVLRGGRQLTAKISEVGSVDFEKAEIYKKEFGLTGKVGEILRESLRPFIREIQQTFKGHLAGGGRPVTQMKLCGGGALLLGLDRYLSTCLVVPVEGYDIPKADATVEIDTNFKGAVYALAYMLALREEVPREKRINVRRGALAFKGDYQVIKRRVRWLAGAALVVVASWGFASFAELSALADRVERQQDQLAKRTETVFGAPILEYERLEEKLGVKSKQEKVPIPTRDAFEVLEELSKRIPFSVVHDMEQLEIKPKRVTIKGLINPNKNSDEEGDTESDMDTEESNKDTASKEGSDLAPTDLIKVKLEEFKECFTAIRVGRVSTVGDQRRYQMDIDSRCP
jgi:general secretion pathway protein L